MAETTESSASKTNILDSCLDLFGFEFVDISPRKVTGRLLVTDKCCQPFKVLHGGLSALIAEALSSIGAHLASGLRRVAGIQLSINHVKPAQIGDHVFAEATPIRVGKIIQVWEVYLWKSDGVDVEKREVVSFARVTLLSNMTKPGVVSEAGERLLKYAKL